MTDYIKRDIERIITNAQECDIDALTWEEQKERLKAVKSVDVAPVVRCKDCKWRNWETNGCDRNPCVEPWFENDFCSYGERKDND